MSVSQNQNARINQVLFFIHQDITKNLTVNELASIAAYSEAHFQRVFQLVVGEPVHQYLRRVRLEYAANQLMFDEQDSVLNISERVGFRSVSSFSRAFKHQFGLAPGVWRRQEQAEDKPFLVDEEIANSYQKLAGMELPKPVVKDVEQRYVVYVRHQGYGREIRNAWQLLLAWANSHEISSRAQFGLHHSNPAWVPLKDCRYVACLEVDKDIQPKGIVNRLVIPGGTHAIFDLQGKYGELLPQISMILEKWLPSSGLKLASTPAYVHYLRNHFVEDDERFICKLYLPVRFY